VLDCELGECAVSRLGAALADVEPPVFRFGRIDSSMKLSVVIPVYNERDNLVPLHFALSEVLSHWGQSYEILFVDDGSRDCSLNVLRRLAEQDPTVKVIELAGNFGQTAALDAGLRMAAGEVIVTLDADLQNDPSDIPRLLAKLDEGYDLVHGWRRQRQDRLLTRRLPSAAANLLIRRVTGFDAHDIGCTLKAVRRETVRDLRLYGELHRFIPVLLHWQGARCAELIVRHHPRRFGEAKYGLSRTLRVAFDLLTVQFLTRYAACPMRFFSRLALAGMALTAIASIAALAMKWGAGVPLAGNALWAVAAIGILGAVQACGLGLVAEVVTRTYFESQGRRPYTIRALRNFGAQADAALEHEWSQPERRAA
jgi:glycosyltransferase involved in cell wall biosynthesis